jgi:hypothetical protein
VRLRAIVVIVALRSNVPHGDFALSGLGMYDRQSDGGLHPSGLPTADGLRPFRAGAGKILTGQR